MDLTTQSFVKSIATGLAERLAIIACTWLVTQKLLSADQLSNAETILGGVLVAVGIAAWTWWQEKGRFVIMKQLQAQVPPGFVPAETTVVSVFKTTDSTQPAKA